MNFFKQMKNAVRNMLGISPKEEKKGGITIREVSSSGKPKKYPKPREDNAERRGPAKESSKEPVRGPKKRAVTDKVKEAAQNVAEKSEKQSRQPEPAKKKSTVKKPKSEESPAKLRNIEPSTPLIEDFVPEAWDVEAHTPPPVEGKTRFAELGLQPSLLRAVHEIGFEYSTDIQAQILPHSLKGIDVTGRAQTGTGKTAAFLLTILQRLITTRPEKQRKTGSPRALIMAPTRELVMQIKKDADELGKFCNARILAIFGGIDYDKQRDALEGDFVDIIIATPGRILDYYKQKIVRLDRVEVLVLDEADRMLDMGFLPDMRRIIDATPHKNERQTMLFSATLPQEIKRLAAMWMNAPIEVEIEPEQVTSADVEQVAYIVSKEDKFTLLFNLLTDMNVTRAMIFANRKDQVRRLNEMLTACDFLCGMLTGDVTQAKRIKTLENLRSGKINILVATDVAGRGIHVDGIEAVFNFTLPDDPDDYVHRIGRTGRAGAKGRSVSFASEEDSYMLPAIEEHIKEPLKYIVPDEAMLAPVPEKLQLKMKNIKRKRSGAPKRGAKPFGDKRKPRS